MIVTIYLHSGEHFDTRLDYDDLEDPEDLISAALNGIGFAWIGDALIHPRAVAAVQQK